MVQSTRGSYPNVSLLSLVHFSYCILFRICKTIEVNFTWLDMLRSLPELCVVNPCGLYAGSECLTYDSNGEQSTY